MLCHSIKSSRDCFSGYTLISVLYSPPSVIPGEKKLSTLATSDPFAKQNSGSSSKTGSSSSTSSSTASTTTRKINENKLLSSKAKLSSMKGMGSNKFMPYETKCKVCKQRVHQHGSRYCQQCAYKNGICAMCGVQILDTSGYKMASK
ncbi:microtubule-associated protein CRIPT-domain-containing protein [Powellomyces hirtus]|nr:microtubule-associated protein CRIPT-domain-containing protein [Powellomyces hirtus]